MFTASLLRTRHGLALLWLLCTASIASAQEYAGYYNGKKIYYEPSTTQVLVKFKNSEALTRRAKVPATLGASNMRPLSSLPNIALMTLIPGQTKSTVSKLVSKLNGDDDIALVNPVLLNKGVPFGSLTDQFIVKLKPTTSRDQFTALLTQTGAALHHQYEYDESTFYLTVDKHHGNALEMANRFYESGLFTYAEPNYVLFVGKTTNDPLYGQQYALHNTGQTGGTSGADMRVLEAWNLTTGASNIRVAVLDNGVQLNHPDLINNLLPGFDATGGGSDGGNTNIYEAHGTSCAGIVGAVANNGIGVAGVAYSCRIVPVRVYTSTSNVDDITTAGWMASGIDFVARNNVAEILSMSFKIHVGQQAITDAINYAATSGRGGRGCLILAATGNNGDSSIDFPASCVNVIAVGASDNTDHRASFGGSDASQYGPGLDVVAPGLDVFTTDLTGSAGYSTNDYTTFSGTSAATPNAAGVMALILSINPNLYVGQARQILESTTSKVNYSDYPYYNGAGEAQALSWNSQMGYGRVNANDAVIAACGSLNSILGPGQVCDANVTFQANSSSANWAWTASPADLFTVSSGTGNQFTTSAAAGRTGTGTITARVQGACSPVTVTKSVSVGAEPTGYFYGGGRSNTTLQTVQFVSAGQINMFMNDNYNFRFTSSDPAIYLNSTYGRSTSFYLGTNQGVTITATADGSPCTLKGNYVFSTSSGYGYSFAPNPTSDELTVTAIEPTATQTTTTSSTVAASDKVAPDFEAELYDSYGKKVKTQRSLQGKAILDVRDLPSGLYNLRIGSGKTGVSEHIQVSH